MKKAGEKIMTQNSNALSGITHTKTTTTFAMRQEMLRLVTKPLVKMDGNAGGGTQNINMTTSVIPLQGTVRESITFSMRTKYGSGMKKSKTFTSLVKVLLRAMALPTVKMVRALIIGFT